MTQHPYTAVLIVPTGIGCAIGGYAGDALPVARAIAQSVDRLITHPNVLNGAQLYWPIENALYVEGYGLDRFAAGDWGLAPVRQNRIGLLLDQAIEPELRLRHLQVADAARATLGLNLTDYVITDEPLGVSLSQADSGATWGRIDRPDALLRGAEKLLDAGATAIAVVGRFPDIADDVLQRYRQGQGIDPLAGAEAVISHLIVREFQVPCAHAPALSPLPIDPNLSPRSAAEELGYTFLPCVLAGLSRAPQLRLSVDPGVICAREVDAVIVPASACGGSALLSWGLSGATILAVEDNHSTLQVPGEALGIQVQRVASYWEAIGWLTCDRGGIDPRRLRAQISSLQSIP
jgi:hypothetical protein